jgi:hypothetical protein
MSVIQPKNRKSFSLSDRMKLAISRDGDQSCPRYDARDLGLDMDKFAYFAMSVVWRGMVETWVMSDQRLPRTCH